MFPATRAERSPTMSAGTVWTSCRCWCSSKCGGHASASNVRNGRAGNMVIARRFVRSPTGLSRLAARRPRLLHSASDLACFAVQRMWGRFPLVAPWIERLSFLVRDFLYCSGLHSRIGWPADNPVLVLCYHAIEDLSHDSILGKYAVPMQQFEWHLDTLLNRGAHFIGADEFHDYVRGKAGVPRQAVLLTFDDGYAGLIDVARRVLQPRRIPALAFVVSGMPSNSNEWDQAKGATKLELLKDEELLELGRLGIEIGCHSKTHRSMPSLPVDDLAEETAGARAQLQNKGLPAPRFFAYPHGESSAKSKRAVQDAGFVGGFGLGQGFATPASDIWDLPRIEMQAGDLGWRFRRKTSTFRLSRQTAAAKRRYLAAIAEKSGLDASEAEPDTITLSRRGAFASGMRRLLKSTLSLAERAVKGMRARARRPSR